MKILWLTNMVLSEKERGLGGTWYAAMAEALADSGKVSLANIAQANVSEVTQQDYGTIRQWAVPNSDRINREGLPGKTKIVPILEAIEEYSPDLVHVWGTETYLGLLTGRRLINRTALLETQGLKFSIASVFQGGLSFQEQIACVGIKEILRGSTIFSEKKRFGKWAAFEKEIISRHRYLAVQTKWVESQVRAVNRSCKIYQSDCILREPFCKATPWQFSGRPIFFCSAAYSAPFKGLHLAIGAAARLKNRFPNVELHIAGGHQRRGIRRSGYVAWLNRKIKQLGLESNVKWLGPLDAVNVVREMSGAAAVLVPSYIENCSVTMQEAMMVGTPVVAACTGGLPEIATDEESGLFFPIGDEGACAHQLERIIIEDQLAQRMSEESRRIALRRNDRDRIVRQQIANYTDMMQG